MVAASSGGVHGGGEGGGENSCEGRLGEKDAEFHGEDEAAASGPQMMRCQALDRRAVARSLVLPVLDSFGEETVPLEAEDAAASSRWELETDDGFPWD